MTVGLQAKPKCFHEELPELLHKPAFLSSPETGLIAIAELARKGCCACEEMLRCEQTHWQKANSSALGAVKSKNFMAAQAIFSST